MKSVFNIAALVMTGLITTNLIGCQKFESDKPTQQQQPTPVTTADLQGKSPAEIVALKYTKLALNCDLRLHYGKTFDVTKTAPTASLTLDLSDAAKRAEKPTMNGNSADQTTIITATLKDFVIEADTSVTAEASFLTTIQGIDEIGGTTETSATHASSFRENVPTTVFSSKEPSDDDSFYFRQLDCTLQAAIR